MPTRSWHLFGRAASGLHPLHVDLFRIHRLLVARTQAERRAGFATLIAMMLCEFVLARLILDAARSSLCFRNSGRTYQPRPSSGKALRNSVTQCKQCGTELPEHARFCLQCGAPRSAGRARTADPRSRHLRRRNWISFSRLSPAECFWDACHPSRSSVAGISLLHVGSLGGGMAAVLLTRQRPLSASPTAMERLSGVLSGLFGAVVGTVVQMSFRAIAARFFESQQQQLEQILNAGWRRRSDAGLGPARRIG